MNAPKPVYFIARTLVASLFITSGFFKLMEPAQNFLAVVQSYEILEGRSAVIFAQSLPWIEFIFGVFLLLGLWRRAAILALWACNSFFIVALFSAFFRHLPIHDCGCFGQSLFSFSPAQMLVNDIFLWLVFLWLW
ncbi:MAG: DoxX family protein [Candidatus Omnitrophica bacterium]|nr:DoxX family protein [Candidatus Omnitrophota bacterium]